MKGSTEYTHQRQVAQKRKRRRRLKPSASYLKAGVHEKRERRKGGGQVRRQPVGANSDLLSHGKVRGPVLEQRNDRVMEGGEEGGEGRACETFAGMTLTWTTIQDSLKQSVR